jgi:hypothetical protein
MLNNSRNFLIFNNGRKRKREINNIEEVEINSRDDCMEDNMIEEKR